MICVGFYMSLVVPSTCTGSGVVGQVMFAATTYIAENKESMNLVEGEKVYVVGKL